MTNRLILVCVSVLLRRRSQSCIRRYRIDRFRPKPNFSKTIRGYLKFSAEECKIRRLQQFTILIPRDALVHSAVLRLHVVRLSVCLSVTLVDQDHIGWKYWKLIARTLSPTPSLFVAQRPSTYSEGNMGKFGGD